MDAERTTPVFAPVERLLKTKERIRLCAVSAQRIQSFF